MSQNIQFTFNEPIPIGDSTYPEGFNQLIPVDQVFGPYRHRQYATFDLFQMPFFERVARGHYRIVNDMTISVGKSVLTQGENVYALPREGGLTGYVDFKADAVGDMHMRVSNVKVSATPINIEPGETSTVTFTFTDDGQPIDVMTDMTYVDKGVYTKDVTATLKPGTLYYPVEFTYDGEDYLREVTFNIAPPEVNVVQITQQILAGTTVPMEFTLEVGGKFPIVSLKSVSTDLGSVGALESIDQALGQWGLVITGPNAARKMNIRAVFDIEGWTYVHTFVVNVTVKSNDVVIDGNGRLDTNLTQLIRMNITLQGEPVTDLTTKSLVFTGAPSLNTYTKRLTKLNNFGDYQLSVYTNNIQGVIYLDITITVNAIDYILPQMPFTVVYGG